MDRFDSIGLYLKTNHKISILYPTGIDTKGKPVYDRYIPKRRKVAPKMIICRGEWMEDAKKVLDSFYA